MRGPPAANSGVARPRASAPAAAPETFRKSRRVIDFEARSSSTCSAGTSRLAASRAADAALSRRSTRGVRGIRVSFWVIFQYRHVLRKVTAADRLVQRVHVSRRANVGGD